MMTTGRRFRLYFAQGDAPWEVMSLNFGEYLLGRSDDCDITLADPNISRQHARLEVSEEGCWIMDLGSANGTVLDGRPLPPNKKKPLSSGVEIIIQGFRLKVEEYIEGMIDSASLHDLKSGDTIGLAETLGGEEDISSPARETPEAATRVVGQEQSDGSAQHSSTRILADIPPDPAATFMLEETGAEDRIVLYFRQGEGNWQDRRLSPGGYILGRSNDSDITLPDVNISRRHARLEVTPSGCFIVDSGSSNGTLLAGKRLEPHERVPFSAGEILSMGDFFLRFETLTPFQQDAAKESPSQAATLVDAVADQSLALVLRFRFAGGEWQQVTLGYGEYILGRSNECDVTLMDADVSRRHVRLELEPGANWIMDLGSANGTQLEGAPLSPRRKTSLETGKVFKISQFELKIEPVKASEAVQSVSPGELKGSLMVSSNSTRIVSHVAMGESATRIHADEEIATRLDDAGSAATRVGAAAAPSGPVSGAVYLRIRQEQDPWQEIMLNYGDFILGRTPDCDISLPEAGVSRKHARIEVTPQGCFIMDLGSANGTQLAGRPLSPRIKTPLALGEVVTIHTYSFSLESAPSEEATQIEAEEVAGLTGSHAAATRVGGALAAAATRAAAGRQPLFLRYREGSGPMQRVVLVEGSQVLGRGSDCEIRIDSKMISRRHVSIHVSGQAVTITDLGSRNGIQVGGRSIPPQQPYRLKAGENFSISDFTFDVASVAAPSRQPLQTGAGGATMVGMELDVMGALDMPMGMRPLNLMGHERVAIGRAPDNQIVFDHPQVSRYHAVIERMGTRSRLLDLHSANGVFVNGSPVDEQAWLAQGDLIKIGPYQIQFTGNELRPSEVQSYTIDVVGIKKWVSKTVNLLQDINLSIGQNEFVALVGMSGAGKSTLMDAINGFRPATHGRVLVNGVDLYENYGMFRDDIGNVPQKDIVHIELTPTQALEYAARLRMPADTSTAERKAAVQETLEDLDLTFRKDVQISRLSGGQLKRVSIGVELLTKPRLFFLDEPTSGLDPGTEYEMMKLLRRLADQGRTIMIITHATKNVMFCDKAIILARGGNVAFYGPPEYALEYFDQFRTARERLEKDMEFDDIYRILNDSERGKPEQWRDRYLQSKYAKYIRPQHAPQTQQPQQLAGAGRRQRGKRISALRQFFILSSRQLKCMVRDKASLGLTLALAPLLGMMNFTWGSRLFSPTHGDAAKVMGMWFITSIIALLVGSMGSVRELVKENDIYRRERAVGLKLFPYVLSKVWLGGALSIYQGAAVLLALLILVRPVVPGLLGYVALLGTMILGIFCGYLLGLLVSALSPNQNSAQIILIAFLVPQFLFAGVLIPLKQIPLGLGEIISPGVSGRWTFEAFVKATGMGDPLASDACWNLPKEERNALTAEQKEICICMGPQLFENCSSIPGILSPDFFTDDAQVALAQSKPEQPARPQLLPSPTRQATPTLFATPTLLPTPTYFNTPTPAPMPRGGNFQAPTWEEGQPLVYDVTKEAQVYAEAAQQVEWRMKAYEQTREGQMVEYQKTREAQFVDYQNGIEYQFYQYRTAVVTQVDEYVATTEAGLEEYQNDSYAHFENFANELDSYGNVLSTWERNRQEAIASAEAILGLVYEDYGRAFYGSVSGRWFNIGVITLVEFILTLIFQKRKD